MSNLLDFNSGELTAIWLSLKVALISVVLALPLALWVGHKMARRDFTGKPVIEALIHLPLVMPPVTTGYVLLLIFGNNGWLGHWLQNQFGIQIAFSFPAAVLAAVVVSFPLMVRAIRTSMEMVDVGYEQASRLLGVGKFGTFMKITVPLALPGIISGTILAFARSLGEFGATITFAGNIAGSTQTLPLAIYSYMQIPGQEGATVRLVLISIVISLVAMILSEWYLKKLKNG